LKKKIAALSVLMIHSVEIQGIMDMRGPFCFKTGIASGRRWQMAIARVPSSIPIPGIFTSKDENMLVYKQ